MYSTRAFIHVAIVYCSVVGSVLRCTVVLCQLLCQCTVHKENDKSFLLIDVFLIVIRIDFPYSSYCHVNCCTSVCAMNLIKTLIIIILLLLFCFIFNIHNPSFFSAIVFHI